MGLIGRAFTSVVFLGVATSIGWSQGEENSLWLNRGDGQSPQFDPLLGEFHSDIGGLIELDRYRGNHPYAALRAQIEALFFDRNALDAVLPGGIDDLNFCGGWFLARESGDSCNPLCAHSLCGRIWAVLYRLRL